FNSAKKKSRKYQLKAPDPFLLYMIGVIILCLMIYNMEITVVAESLSTVGGMVFLVFATAIPWIFANAMSIANLTRNKIPFLDLLYIELTGDAYNAIIPLAGLGGEPYKIKQINNWLDLDVASNAIVHNRLIHSLTGILFTSIMVALSVYLVDLPENIILPMMIASGVLFVVAAIMTWVTLSSAPTRLSAYIMRKLQILDNHRVEALPASRFLISFFFKMLGRALNLLELMAIFYVLGYDIHMANVVMVSAFLSLSATLFFIIPQGLGVNEAGVSTAFVILGLGAPVGLIFGLVRRARVIFWAIVGVALHVTVLIIRKITNRPMGGLV
ncbi:MAG: lysylphosphatidylglycerol synthase domain-containing protein, partial [Bacteroidota bacterium]